MRISANQPTTEPPARPAPRTLTRRLLLPAASVLLLGGAEALLRIAGVGHATDFLIATADGSGFVPNGQFGRAFHCPESPAPFFLPADKPADAVWIFVLGESAAHGTPDPAFAPGRVLEVLLRGRYPGKQIRVFNAAMMGINSYAIARIARECADHGADLLIVHAGNNELAGSFGTAHFASRLPPPVARWFTRAGIAARSSRIGQVIARALAPDAGRRGQDERYFLDRRIARDDPRRETVRRNFAENLREVCALARDGGVKVIVSTVAVNLRDCPPFGSPAAGDAGAPDAFENARRLEQTAQFDLAALEYQAACDGDALPFRTDSRLNGAIRGLQPPGAGAAVVDCAKAIALADAEEHHIPGGRLFHDHVHFRFAGACALARALLDPVTRALGTGPGAGGESPGAAGLTDEEAAARLAYTSWDELKLQASMTRFFARPPCSLQRGHEERLAAARADLARRERAFTPAEQRRCVRIYEEALARAPDDTHLQVNFAELLDAIGRPDAALLPARLAAQQFPGHEPYGRLLAGLLAKQPNRAPSRDPIADYHFENGNDLLPRGEVEEAIAEFRLALRRDGTSAQTHNNLGTALLRAGATNEALAAFARAIALMPGHAGAHFNLGLALHSQRRFPEAAVHLRRAVELKFPSPMAAVRLAWILSTADDPALRNGAEAVGLAEEACAATSRQMPAALASLAAAYAECGRFDDALRVAGEQRALLERTGAPFDAAGFEALLSTLRARRPLRQP